MTTYNADITGTTAGAVAVNAYSGFTNPAATVSNTTAYGTTAHYIAATDPNRMVFQTTNFSRDMEVTTWTRNGVVYLRLDPLDRAIAFVLNGEVTNGYMSIMPGIVCDAAQNLTIDGIRVLAPNVNGIYENVAITNDNGVTKSCVVDNIFGGTQTSNQTNLQWTLKDIPHVSDTELADLLSELTTDFADNNQGRITAAKLRVLIQALLADVSN